VNVTGRVKEESKGGSKKEKNSVSKCCRFA